MLLETEDSYIESLHPNKRKVNGCVDQVCLVIVRGAVTGARVGDHAELTGALGQNHPQLISLHLATLE